MESNHDKFGLKRHKSTTYKGVALDRISCYVPDEILVSILSKLSCIKEAARSSILSRRWEKLWIGYQGNFEFDATITLHNDAMSNSSVNQIISHWPQISWDLLKSMNQALRPLLSCCFSGTFNSLILRCQYFETQRLEFDLILQLLMSKGIIRIFELDMNPMNSITDFLTLPLEFYDWIKQPRGLQTISALTSLSFHNVSLTNDTIEYFVSNCPLLERLCVRRSNLLSHLRIVGDASLKLKYLKVQGFGKMKSLVVSASNLLSLDYLGNHKIKLNVSNVPKLVEVAIGEHIMTYMSGSLSTYLAQIHSLKLSFMTVMPFDLIAPNNVVFGNLKHLVLRALIYSHEDSLLRFTSSLVEASPMLEKFTLDPIGSFEDHEVGLHKMTTPTGQQFSQNHQRLKVVELTGFMGATPEVELFFYFVQNFSSLGQIVIDTTPTSERFTMETPNEVLQARKERAMQLMKHVPHGVDFLLI